MSDPLRKLIAASRPFWDPDMPVVVGSVRRLRAAVREVEEAIKRPYNVWVRCGSCGAQTGVLTETLALLHLRTRLLAVDPLTEPCDDHNRTPGHPCGYYQHYSLSKGSSRSYAVCCNARHKAALQRAMGEG